MQFLHYDTYEQAISSTTDLVNRSQSLFEEWISSYRASSGGLKRWYEINIYKVFALRWYSEQLSHHMNEVKLPVEIDTKDLFSYMDGKGFERTSEIALSIAPLVISEYGNLIRENFLKVSHLFETYKALQGRLLIELAEDTGHFKSDFLHLSYIWLPSIQSGPVTLRFVKFEESLPEVFIMNRKSAGNIFAKNIPVKTRIDDIEVFEERAVISRVRYPDSQPVTSQVYQLVMNEISDVFGELFWNWKNYLIHQLRRRLQVVTWWIKRKDDYRWQTELT